MHDPLISVIVPVYKAEAYLEKCVNSIRNQTYRNLEIILVDDGSPDRCGEICDELAKCDSRIRVFHKENGGQSSARNLALDNMNGEYVAFVDSDDYIQPNMYESLYNHAVNFGAKIVCCGIRMEYSDGKIGYYNRTYAGETEILRFTTMQALEESLKNVKITFSPCDKLYHKSIFDNIRMTVGRIFEDMEMIPHCLELSEVIVYDPYPYYCYNLTDESTIRGEFNVRRFAEADVALEKAMDYKTRYPNLYPKAMSRYIASCLGIVHFSAGVASCNERRQELIAVLRGKLPHEAINCLSKGERIKLAVLRISPAIYELLMCVYDKLMSR